MENEKRLIDANAFIEEHCAECKYFRVNGICHKENPLCTNVRIALKLAAKLPTIDAVEVVRCKDCKHLKYGYQCYNPLGMNLNNDGDAYVLVAEDDFCSYGERKDNG